MHRPQTSGGCLANQPHSKEPARQRLVAKFASPCQDWSFLQLHRERDPAPGEAAQIIEYAIHAFPPAVFVEFARENEHWYTPELLGRIFKESCSRQSLR